MAAEKIRGNREIAALRCRSARNDGWGDCRAALPLRPQ